MARDAADARSTPSVHSTKYEGRGARRRRKERERERERSEGERGALRSDYAPHGRSVGMACKREERSHRTDRGARARVPLRECTASVCRGPPHRPHWPRIANEPGRQSVCVSESERCSCSNAVRPRRRSLQRYGRVYLLSILNPPSSKALHRRWRQRRQADTRASVFPFAPVGLPWPPTKGPTQQRSPMLSPSDVRSRTKMPFTEKERRGVRTRMIRWDG